MNAAAIELEEVAIGVLQLIQMHIHSICKNKQKKKGGLDL